LYDVGEMIEIFVYRNGAEEIEEGFEPKDLPRLLADETNVVWVNIEAYSEADKIEGDAVLLNFFKFHPLTVEDARETRNQPKVEAFPHYLFFIVHGVKPGETNPANFATKELDGFLGKNFLVTYHIEPFRSIDKIKRNLRETTYSCERGASYLLHQVLDELVDLYIPIVDDFDSAITDLEDRIFRMKKANNKILEEIMDVKRAVARLRRISSKQLDVLYKMAHGQFPLIDEHIQPFFRDVHDHLQRISDLSEGYRDLVSGLLDIHFAVISNKTNEVMKVLAIFSAIMLPLSLIAGIYGMNMKLYGDTDNPGYFWYVIILMFLIAVGLLLYFWRRGWIGGSDLEKIPDDEGEK
jgi:magnesium transporter